MVDLKNGEMEGLVMNIAPDSTKRAATFSAGNHERAGRRRVRPTHRWSSALVVEVLQEERNPVLFSETVLELDGHREARSAVTATTHVVVICKTVHIMVASDKEKEGDNCNSQMKGYDYRTPWKLLSATAESMGHTQVVRVEKQQQQQ
jgi:hypothetical protein